ncbi:BCCT family transporter [Isoptericola sp. b408]|uniref:BCCT family transporter n=1 Tax=Isoptericola sp. b408 TaxID=3064653 RepID=UPI002713C46F|nr:BCCT family transporter [Isoptericola sp. b408]MDO8150299.1 BCCT family transporter [Isoptericola sp. b408]
MTSTPSTSDRTPDTPDRSAGKLRSAVLKPVFIPASIVILGLIIATIVFARVAGDTLDDATSQLNTWITDGVGWWYVIAVNIFLVFALYCAFTRIGHIRLGRDGEGPEFGTVSWFLMLFSAGMGIGLVFFGVAEPLSHYVTPPEAFGNAPQSDDAARESVGLMMLQWGFHPWAIYAVVGLGLAYMSFRRGRPLAVRWLLEPLLGRRRVEGWMGHTVDTVAIVGTLFGVATSFGFGISQILGGLEFLGWAQTTDPLIIGLITGITAVAVWSVVTGVHKGLKWLSNFNMSTAAVLALVVFLLGPTVFLLKAIPENAGAYLSLLPETMFHAGPFASDGWEAAWTIAYWGWWTSWAPFVGMFIARISRGRTIREFVVGVLLAPTAASLLWFTIFGDSGILQQREQGNMLVEDPETGEMVVDSTTALFQFFETFPGVLPVLLSVVAMVVVVLFFVTSSDSGSLVIDMLASGGSTHTSTTTRVYWAVLEGLAAAVLLVVGGNVALTALQTLSISTAAPFSIILVLACVSLVKAFRHEVATMPRYIQVLPPTDEAEPDLAPAEHRHRRGPALSTTLYGFAPTASDGHRAGVDGDGARGDGEPESPIISYRALHPSDVVIDPETGDPVEVEPVEDPLAGEVFDTPEFEHSQEFLDQGGQLDDDGNPRPETLDGLEPDGRPQDAQEEPRPAG